MANMNVQDVIASLDNTIDFRDTNIMAQHNNFYRGKFLGNALTAEQSANIRNGTFKDLYIGDYWVIGNITWRIVAIDYYYSCGDTACTTHHVVVVPDTSLYTAQMNTSNVVTGGYIGSAMYTSNLNTAKTTISNAFGSGHILTIRQLFTNSTNRDIANAFTWVDAAVWLMNEVNVYGTYACTNVNYTNGWNADKYSIDNSQYPAFTMNPRLIHIRQDYWLRNVAYSASFAYVGSGGLSYTNYASSSFGVRPAFAIY